MERRVEDLKVFARKRVNGLFGSKPIIPLFGSLFDPIMMMDRIGMKRCEENVPMEYVVDAVCTITWQAKGPWRTSLW